MADRLIDLPLHELLLPVQDAAGVLPGDPVVDRQVQIGLVRQGHHGLGVGADLRRFGVDVRVGRQALLDGRQISCRYHRRKHRRLRVLLADRGPWQRKRHRREHRVRDHLLHFVLLGRVLGRFTAASGRLAAGGAGRNGSRAIVGDRRGPTGAEPVPSSKHPHEHPARHQGGGRRRWDSPWFNARRSPEMANRYRRASERQTPAMLDEFVEPHGCTHHHIGGCLGCGARRCSSAATASWARSSLQVLCATRGLRSALMVRVMDSPSVSQVRTHEHRRTDNLPSAPTCSPTRIRFHGSASFQFQPKTCR